MSGILDFLLQDGQKRRQQLDQAVSDFMTYITPPNLRPAAKVAAQMNPIQGMQDSMQAGGVVFDPEQTAEARKRAAMDMGIEMAMTLTPAALAARGYLTPVQGLMEALVGGSPAQQQIAQDAVNLVSDVKYAGRSIAEGDVQGLIDVLRSGREARPLSAGAPMNVTDDVAERGDTILNMLKSGQADNITDAMLDMGDSVKNTQLNQYLFQNYDLPMDEASRMARAQEMGFEGGFLHGTGSDIAAVDTSRLGEKQNVLGKGFYQTTNPERSDRYVPKVVDSEGNLVFAEGGNVMPLMTKSADEFDLMDYTGKQNIRRIADAFDGSDFDVDLRDGGDSVFIRSKTDPKMSVFLDSKQEGQATLMRLKDAFGNNNVTPILQEAGFTGVKGFESRGSNVRVNYNPQDVRSRFARFDPRLSHLSGLTAMVAIAPLGGLVAQGMVSQEELEDYLRQKGL